MIAQLAAMGAGPGLLVPPLTSTLLGSVERARSGIGAGSQLGKADGSVLGVALFGSLVSQLSDFTAGALETFIASRVLLTTAASATMVYGRTREN